MISLPGKMNYLPSRMILLIYKTNPLPSRMILQTSEEPLATRGKAVQPCKRIPLICKAIRERCSVGPVADLPEAQPAKKSGVNFDSNQWSKRPREPTLSLSSRH